jgi:hypothetical protein
MRGKPYKIAEFVRKKEGGVTPSQTNFNTKCGDENSGV